MVEFEKFVLDNGLRVLVHEDSTTPLAAVNVLYDVGARDENHERTGFAHLFEHLMFEGSVNIPDFDQTLQLAGGENNAFTNNDITNYYLTIPAQNLETAFWLESDRMLGLSFSQEKLDIQKNVVIEEFKQSYLNQPFGDLWLLLRPLVYKKHPYQWPTIGKSTSHVRDASMDEVVSFFNRFYRPSNAIVSVTGNVNAKQVRDLAQKWFGNIPSGKMKKRDLPQEPEQKEKRFLEVERDVPHDEIYLVFKTGTRSQEMYYLTDLITDIFSGGQSGRLKDRLVYKKNIFHDVNAWISGSFDKGFLAISGKLRPEINTETALDALWNEMNDLCDIPVSDDELQKVKNKLEANNTFSEAGILSKAMNLAYYELLGDANMLNHQMDHYFRIQPDDIRKTSSELFTESKVSQLNYLAKK